MTNRQLADKMAEALEALLYDLCGEQEAEDEITKAIGKHAAFSVVRAKQALAAYMEAHQTPTTPCTPSSQDPN